MREGSGFFPLPLGVAWLLFGLKHVATPPGLHFVAKAIAYSRIVRFRLIEFAVGTGFARFPLGGVFDFHPFYLLSILVYLPGVSVANRQHAVADRASRFTVSAKIFRTPLPEVAFCLCLVG